jgi:coenzyme F420-0:L-glutamate ligase/coenzyme F420-1:gamma-L-glutamate ligase
VCESDRFSPDCLFEVIRSRRSIRRYDTRPVSREMVERVLSAAMWAPSAHNRQPWRFIVLTRLEDKSQLARAMGERLEADLRSDGLAAEEIARRVERSYARLTGAPVLILVCLTMADMDAYPDGRRQAHEHTLAVQSVAMAAQNLLLMAHALGLGARWMCAPLFCQRTVREALSLPDDYESQGVVTLGYPAEKHEGTRAALRTRVIFR